MRNSFAVVRLRRTAGAGALVTLSIVLAACSSLSRKEKGAIIGAGAGGVVGGVIGNQTGSTARGAIIGAAVGGAVGAIIGHQMDQQAKELQQNIPGATVTRGPTTENAFVVSVAVSTQTRSDGSFTLADVSPGEYTLVANSPIQRVSNFDRAEGRSDPPPA